MTGVFQFPQNFPLLIFSLLHGCPDLEKPYPSLPPSLSLSLEIRPFMTKSSNSKSPNRQMSKSSKTSLLRFESSTSTTMSSLRSCEPPTCHAKAWSLRPWSPQLYMHGEAYVIFCGINLMLLLEMQFKHKMCIHLDAKLDTHQDVADMMIEASGLEVKRKTGGSSSRSRSAA